MYGEVDDPLFSEAVVEGCKNNQRIKVKYSQTGDSNGDIYYFHYFEFSKSRMNAVKEGYLKLLEQVAEKLTTCHGFPQEIVDHIMGHYVDPYHYMETTSMFQPDGQHIIPLLGWENDVADFS